MLMKEKIFLDSKVSQKPGNIVSDMDGEKVMLNINKGNYYNLGEIGGVIWDMMKEAVSVESLIETLMNEYEVEKEECENHVISFINKLSSEGLIIISKR